MISVEMPAKTKPSNPQRSHKPIAVAPARKSAVVPALPLKKAAPSSAPTTARRVGLSLAAPVDSAPASRRLQHLPKFAALAVVVIVAVILLQPQGPSESPAPAAPVARRVAAPGLIEPESGVMKLSFEIAGKIRAVNIREGQIVKAGQIVAELESADQQARLAAANAALRATEMNRRIVEHDIVCELARCERNVDRFKAEYSLLKAGPRPEEISRAQAAMAEAEADARRATEEAKRYSNPAGIDNGAWSMQQRDNILLLAETSGARLKAARAALQELESGYRKQDIDKAGALLGGAEAELARCVSTREARLELAKAQHAEALARSQTSEVEVQRTILRAPIDGTVLWTNHYVGESVGVLSPDPVMAIADCSRMRVRADVDEADFAQLKVEQRVRIVSEAFQGKSFKGTLVRISDSAGRKRFSTGESRERVDIKVLETTIRFDEPCPLRMGVRVTTYFEMDKAK